MAWRRTFEAPGGVSQADADTRYVNESDHAKAAHDALGIAPGDATVTDAKVAADAAIAEPKLALASDAAAATASRRTLGIGAQQAAAGSHLHDDRYYTETETDGRFAAIGHVDSRDGHPLSTASLNGLMSSADKSKLDGVEPGALKRPSRIFVAPNYATNPYTLAGVLANTWTRMRNGTVYDPRIEMPILGSPPPGTAWKMRVGSGQRLSPPVAGTVYFAAGVGTNWTLGSQPVLGTNYLDSTGAYTVVFDNLLDVPDPTVAFTLTFALFGPAGDYVIRASPFPYVEAFLVAT